MGAHFERTLIWTDRPANEVFEELKEELEEEHGYDTYNGTFSNSYFHGVVNPSPVKLHVADDKISKVIQEGRLDRGDAYAIKVEQGGKIINTESMRLKRGAISEAEARKLITERALTQAKKLRGTVTQQVEIKNLHVVRPGSFPPCDRVKPKAANRKGYNHFVVVVQPNFGDTSPIPGEWDDYNSALKALKDYLRRNPSTTRKFQIVRKKYEVYEEIKVVDTPSTVPLWQADVKVLSINSKDPYETGYLFYGWVRE